MDCANNTDKPGGALTSNQQNCQCIVSSFEFVMNVVYIETTFANNQDIFYNCCRTGSENISFNCSTYWTIKYGNTFTFPDKLSLIECQKKKDKMSMQLGQSL